VGGHCKKISLAARRRESAPPLSKSPRRLCLLDSLTRQPHLQHPLISLNSSLRLSMKFRRSFSIVQINSVMPIPSTTVVTVAYIFYECRSIVPATVTCLDPPLLLSILHDNLLHHRPIRTRKANQTNPSILSPTRCSLYRASNHRRAMQTSVLDGPLSGQFISCIYNLSSNGWLAHF